MSHRRNRSGRSSAPDDTQGERNAEIERGIDAVNTLRSDMRKLGLTECADMLDKAFVHCVKDYLRLKHEATVNEADNGIDKASN